MSGPSFFKGIKRYPYFDTATAVLITHDYEPGTEQPIVIGAEDCNGDGIPDLIAATLSPPYGYTDFFLYYGGGGRLNNSGFLYPNNSVQTVRNSNWHGATSGIYSKGGKPMAFIAQSDKTHDTIPKEIFQIGVLRHLNDLAHDSLIILSHTTDAPHWYNPGSDSMIATTGLYTMDITGDGISDLLVTDGVYIYVFKGTDSLGYYPLTKTAPIIGYRTQNYSKVPQAIGPISTSGGI